MPIRGVALAMTLSLSVVALASRTFFAQQKQESVDVVIVGAGIAGLSAALEAARGGHKILSNGAIAIVAIAGATEECRFPRARREGLGRDDAAMAALCYPSAR
jgi:hypothetical protein